MKGLKKLLPIAMIVAMLSALLVPATVLAETGTDGGVTGKVTGGNAAPTVTSVEFYNGAMTEKITALDPDTEVAVKIVAADDNTIDDIKQLDIHIYYGATDPASWDADACAIYKWLKSGDIWSLEDGVATNTWAVDDPTSTIPVTMSDLSGTWFLVFTPGQLAQEASGAAPSSWLAWVQAIDVANASGNQTVLAADDASMAAYCSITSDLSEIDFGTVALSGTAVIPGVGNDIVTSVVANDSYALKFHSEATWTTGAKTIALETATTPGVGEFKLEIDNAATSGVPTIPQQVQSSGATTITDLDAVARASTDPAADEDTSDNNLYIQLTLGASGVRPEQYTGTVTFTVENS